MKQLTYLDILRMEDALAEARRILAEAAQVARGEKVRITFLTPGKAPESWVYPARVAEYAAQAMGNSVPLVEAPKLVFFTQGAAQAVQPSHAGYYAFLRAILAHNEANLRRNKRALNRCLRKLAAQQQGGGHA